ncbi:hypothetical protein HDA36_006351 [Nocardiopsis composta]|uniref:Uncharacterized protein n=1 Tax=Nocardiopsis composta TaxID=157465 RepID=A0A7W8QUK2_9ACTN|nr:hypothetical protein [Nocardiopsis composta]
MADGRPEEAGQVLLGGGDQAAQLRDGQLDHRAVLLLGVDGRPGGAADPPGRRRRVVAEGGQASAVGDLVPVAPLLQSVAAARWQHRPGGGVLHSQPSGGEEPVHGEQAVQGPPEGVGRPRRAAVGAADGAGIDVVAGGDRHHRRTDLGRGERPAQRQEAPRFEPGHRPEREAAGRGSRPRAARRSSEESAVCRSAEPCAGAVPPPRRTGVPPAPRAAGPPAAGRGRPLGPSPPRSPAPGGAGPVLPPALWITRRRPVRRGGCGGAGPG